MIPDWKFLFAFAKKTLIWVVFFLILYTLRDLFDLIFFTFILAFFALSASEFAVERLRLSRWLALMVIYVALLGGLCGVGYIVVPRVLAEARQFARDLPQAEAKVLDTIDQVRLRYKELAPLLDEKMIHEEMQGRLSLMREHMLAALPAFLKGILQVLSNIVLSIIFSFLIVLDLAQLSREMRRLRATRLHDFFQETAMPVVRFGQVVGRAFEAQTFIAVANTLLTVLGMMMLGIPKVALLGIIVFFCSFVPVLGVFISCGPILLVAVNSGGPGLAAAGVAMIMVVHALEAYVLNPRIYAHHMKMNPVLTLIVLFLGHHVAGIWGMLLAVPVTYYFITHVAGLRPEKLLAPNPAQSAGAESPPGQPSTGA